MKIMLLIILAFSLNACVPDISGDTNTDSFNTNETVITDSNNIYNADQESIIEDGYVPNEAGICNSGYFWCSIEQLCLPSIDGASCPVEHTDEDEAESLEINENDGKNTI